MAVGVAPPCQAAPAPESAALRTRGYKAVYNLDYEEAVSAFQQAVAADRNDAAAYRGLAVIAWMQILFQRGALTIDDYLGRARPTYRLAPPPQDVAAMFHNNVTQALKISEQLAAAAPGSADAHYQIGATVGLQSSFTATVEGKLLNGFRAARRAYDAHERVLELDPARKDAGLIVGTYRYIVSTLPAPMRMMAYMAGFGGGRERGITQIEEASRFGTPESEVGTDARFALVLIYNRERRYADALRVIDELKALHPRNRLLWLTAGGTALRGRRFQESLRELDEGFAMLKADRRKRMFGEDALWRYYRGAALTALRRLDAADRELRAGLESESRDWVKGRLHLELGKLADLMGKREDARVRYRTASDFFDRDNDNIGRTEAGRLLRTPYR
jgi:tetratricopeptide (TPR) repeat protein